VPGDTIYYTLYYENIGGADAYNVLIEDTLPDDTLQSFAIGTVLAGESGSVQAQWTVPFDLEYWHNCLEIWNEATLSYEDININVYDPLTDGVWAHIITPIMDFRKDVDKTQVGTGDFLTYTLSYMNIGGATACDVEIVDILPDGVTFVSSYPDYYSIDGQVITWKFGNVEPSVPAGIITITVRVNQDTFCNDLINLATLDYFDRNENAYPTLGGDAQSHTMLQTWITDTSEERCPVTDFRIVFTPDITPEGLYYKISSTNPGGFYFNMLFHANDETETIDYFMHEHFTTKGARPIHAYYWTDLNEDGSPFTLDGCIDWNEFVDITEKIINYGSNPITLTELEADKDILITIHITYALKKTSGYEPGEANAFNEMEYIFWADVNSWHSEVSLIAHARVKGIKASACWGVAQDATLEDTPIMGITFSLYNSKGRCVDSYTTDEYGFYIFDNLKPGTYVLEIEIPLQILVEGLGETDLVLCITMEIKLNKVDFIQVSVFIDGDTTTVEGPPGLAPSESIVDSSSSSSYPGDHTRPFRNPGDGDYGYVAEPIVASSNLGIPIIVAWFASISFLAYAFDARKRKKLTRSKSEVSYWKSSLEWSFEETPTE
jgi:uncharacterized repeat protein (TIGR01451 family)